MLQAQRLLPDADTGAEMWTDVATVEVASGTKRKTAIKAAAKAWGATVPDDGLPVRLIRAEDAEVLTLRPKPPEQPELEVI